MDLKNKYSYEEYSDLKTGLQYPYQKVQIKDLEDKGYIYDDGSQIIVDKKAIALNA